MLCRVLRNCQTDEMARWRKRIIVLVLVTFDTYPTPANHAI